MRPASRAILVVLLGALLATACGSGAADGALPWGAGEPPAQATAWGRCEVVGDTATGLHSPIEVALGGAIDRVVEVWLPEGARFAGGDAEAALRFDPPASFVARGESIVTSRRLDAADGTLWTARQPLRVVGALGEVELPALDLRVARARPAAGGAAEGSGEQDGAGADDESEPRELNLPPIALHVGGLGDDPAATSDLSTDPSSDPTTISEDGAGGDLWAPPPRDLPARWNPLLLGALAVWLLAAVGLSVWWLRRGRERPTDHTDGVPLPAHVLALRELARLRGLPRASEAEVEALYVGVSHVLRQYFERRFGLRAPERTTEEFLPEVESRALLDSTRQALLREFLQACDLVKFAGSRPLDESHERMLSIAVQIVETTREDGATATSGSAAAVGAILAVPFVQDAAAPVAELPEGWTLLDPWFLPLGLLLPVIAVVWRARSGRAALPAADGGAFAGLPRSLRQRVAWLPLVLQLLAVLALSFALARPAVRELLPNEQEGIDILLVLDRSSSMQTPERVRGQDRAVQRVVAARTRAEEFVLARPDDRIGVLTFALFPELICPLTLDKEAVASFLRAVETVEPNSPEDRTAIGVALAEAVRALEAAGGESRVIVLLTDGANNVDAVLPADAGKFAADADVRVYTIGFGSPPRGLFGPMRVDWSELESVAESTGGAHFVARDAEQLAEVYERIDELERVPLEDPRYVVEDFFEWPLLFGIGLLLCAWVVELAWIREVPA